MNGVDLLRVYFDPDEIGPDGYPFAWHKGSTAWVRYGGGTEVEGSTLSTVAPAIKDLIRDEAGHRCVRCGHPYRKGDGEWSRCDEHCTHDGPTRIHEPGYPQSMYMGSWTEAQWRILTVHHLNGVKHDCRWWNLTSLCQRCHLTIQGKVYMERPWRHEHSEWFKPYVAGFYAWHFLGEEISRDEAVARLDELLALEDVQLELSPRTSGGPLTTGERRSS